ncbi:hypothetical protein ACO0LC_08165 [Undibacterium sp. JH2W]|uniref:hypothetical protein n=1 Tax=Undibacterium sp. JH2W TaxID=3413037 RepID=UPI003BF123E2
MKKFALTATFSLCLLTAPTAHAGSGYYLVSIYENEGEKTIDFKTWSSFIDNRPTSTVPELGFSYMPNKTWYTEVYASWFRRGAASLANSAWTWQNDFLLTHGQYPVDLALHTSLNKNTDSSRGVDFEFGPAMQTEFGHLQVNTNLFLERTYRINPATRMQMKYQWQTKYRYRPELEFGVQGFGELGNWDNWSTLALQSHRAGPMVSGTFRLGGTVDSQQALGYEASYVVGKLNTRHAGVFSMRLQYAF